jgi:hypothetical protein
MSSSRRFVRTDRWRGEHGPETPRVTRRRPCVAPRHRRRRHAALRRRRLYRPFQIRWLLLVRHVLPHPFRIVIGGKHDAMSFLTRRKRTNTRYLIEVPHEPDERLQVMDEIVGRGPHDAELFWCGCHVGEHSAWTILYDAGRRR